MPKSVALPDATTAKLAALARPFIDTSELHVIDKLADEELARRREMAPAATNAAQLGLRRLNPDRTESLTHTKVLSATINGVAVDRPKWNTLLNAMIVLGAKRLVSFDALKNACRANLRKGRYQKDGYQYLEELDLSVQGVDSNLAWDHSLRLARHLRVAINVQFEWRDKKDAAHPGEVGVLDWTPPPSLAIA